ncbi:E3 ubiquitin-protein ligase TRIM7-like isoform X2 [Rhineura floridana]|uniref:E3 ubiquitin-protein ligase TRIM7-like isoform X2 n=1 Tax=Rhineura floridana TaxID=261503 RepID=UPI002AC810FB|nr:E3 ubiquitin-protein ligase TRIM7-like isoform X2 [Rhineura floridana]
MKQLEMKEVQKEITSKRDEHLVRLSEELSSLDSIMREMEEKRQEPVIELLQGIGSFWQRLGGRKQKGSQDAKVVSLNGRYCRRRRHTVKIREEGTRLGHLPTLGCQLVVFPPVLMSWIWDLSDINPFLEGIMKQFKDMLISGLPPQEANVTFDPDTAHPELILYDDCKSVRDADLAENPERFDIHQYVLGREGFTAGRHFWEVAVGSEETWIVGVARKSVKRKDEVISGPEEWIWEMGKWNGEYRASIPPDYLPLSLSENPKRIRVTLNCEGGRVAFYDADTAALLHTFSAASFSGQTLLPLFTVSEDVTSAPV